jgi:glycosyltransferase involved in cell wall biosynthesis
MILFFICSACILVQILFAVWMLWSGPASGNAGRKEEPNNHPLSIIICARNEAANLRKNLELILQQDHPHFEVVVINDRSDDDTVQVLDSFSAYPNLVTIHIPVGEQPSLPGKKFALSKGVALAKHEHLLLCDADCAPASTAWARLMASPLQKKKEIIAGYGPYERRKGCLNVFIRWETLHTFIQYCMFTRSGMPYMAVGRNLACTKSVLLKAQSHPYWQSMPSGDDDLLIRISANRHNTRILQDPAAFTYSIPKLTFTSWCAQKQRHLSTGKLYRQHIKVLLGVYGLTHGLMWLLFVVLCLMGNAYLVSTMMVLRCLLSWSVWALSARAMQEKSLLLLLPLCDVGWALYNLFLSPYIFFKTKKQWT